MGKKDAYEIVTDKMISIMESGIVPWKKPWISNNPRNHKTGTMYSGINHFLLSHFPKPHFLTYKQASALGGNVKKGSTGHPVTFWKELKIEDKKTGEKKNIPMMRYYTVFNQDQIEGIEFPELETDKPKGEIEALKDCETIISGYPAGPEIYHDQGNRAYYSPSLDQVHMPGKDLFNTSAGYYETIFHELGHSTGHVKRLDRQIMGIAAFGGTSYSKEELVAEMTAGFLCDKAGILRDCQNNMASYLQGWLKVLKSDKKFLIQAAGKAQKAANHILGKA